MDEFLILKACKGFANVKLRLLNTQSYNLGCRWTFGRWSNPTHERERSRIYKGRSLSSTSLSWEEMKFKQVTPIDWAKLLWIQDHKSRCVGELVEGFKTSRSTTRKAISQMLWRYVQLSRPMILFNCGGGRWAVQSKKGRVQALILLQNYSTTSNKDIYHRIHRLFVEICSWGDEFEIVIER